MTIEKGCLRDWDDRHYQSIDDLPPEAWDAVRDAKDSSHDQDAVVLLDTFMQMWHGDYKPIDFVSAVQQLGFKRD